MKISEIVNQLMNLYPQLDDKLTDDVPVSSIVRSETEMTVSCDAKHGLEIGQAFAIVNSDVPIAITSLTKVGALATLVVATNHDITKSINSVGDVVGSSNTVRITGATESQFNGTFTIVDVVNRRTITFIVPDTSFGILGVIGSSDRGWFAPFGIASEETEITAPVASASSIKITSDTLPQFIILLNSHINSTDISTSVALSFWIYAPSNTFAQIRATNSIVIRFASSEDGIADFNEYSFDKTDLIADTWVQLFVDIVNDTPSASNGIVDFTDIIYSSITVFATTTFTTEFPIYFDDIDKGITIASGTPLLRDAESALRSYNKTHEVKEVLDATSFIFTHPVTALADPDGAILLRVKPRITGGINIDRLIQAYTAQQTNKYWAFVVLGDATVSQSRTIESDALDNQQRSSSFRQQMVDIFSVYIVIPVSDEIAARDARDKISDILRPLLRSLLFSKLSTGLHADILNPVQFEGHGVHTYNTSVYVHAFNFLQVAEIYEEDTVGPDLDVAFRDIDFKIFYDFGTQIEFLQGTPDLDDTPL